MANLFEQEYRIHYYEIDLKKGACHEPMVLDDVATSQSEKLGT